MSVRYPVKNPEQYNPIFPAMPLRSLVDMFIRRHDSIHTYNHVNLLRGQHHPFSELGRPCRVCILYCIRSSTQLRLFKTPTFVPLASAIRVAATAAMTLWVCNDPTTMASLKNEKDDCVHVCDICEMRGIYDHTECVSITPKVPRRSLIRTEMWQMPARWW